MTEMSPTLNLRDFQGLNIDYDRLATVLGERLQSGAFDEVADFLTGCEIDVLKRLNWKEGVWRNDPALWLHLATITAQRNILLGWLPSQLRDKAHTDTLRAIAVDCLNNGGENKDTIRSFIYREIGPRLSYPGISRDEIMEVLTWISPFSPGDVNSQHELFDDLIRSLDSSADLLTAARIDIAIAKSAIKFNARKSDTNSKFRWDEWRPFLKANPKLIDTYIINDIHLLEWVLSNKKAQDQEKIAADLIRHYKSISETGYELYEAELDRLIKKDESLFVRALENYWYGRHSVPFLTLIFEKEYPKLTPMLLTLIATDSYSDKFTPLVVRILSANPQAIAKLSPAGLMPIIKTIPADTLTLVLPQLTAPLSSSSSKTLRAIAATAAKKLALEEIVKAGWLSIKNKNMRLVCRDILMAHPDTATAAPLLAELIASGGLDIAAASAASEYLTKISGGDSASPQSTGIDISNEVPLVELEAQVAKVKRLAAVIKHYDIPAIINLMQPLSEHTARVVLHLAATCEADLPPLTHALLGHISAEKRAQLSQSLTEQWIAGEGDPKLRWALKLVGSAADDRIVDLLANAVFAWGKVKKQRAVVAVEQLGALNTLYALARVNEVINSRKVKEMVSDAATNVINNAAKKRGISVVELQDEFTPDFGLSKGITLIVGATTYEVILQGDLTLRLKDKNGKLSKSLPATKDATLKEVWEAANSQFKTLAGALKNIVKQQAPRMEAAFIAGKTWPFERWARLFLHHPLLRVMGQSLIWQTQEEQPRSFRIAEDYSLLDAEDNVIDLPTNTLICLWHPVNVTTAEVAAWKTSLADYELEGMIEQINAPTQLPPPESLKDDQILAPAKLKIAQEQLAGLLRKWGYIQGPVGDGPSIEWFELPLPALQLRARLKYDYFPPYMSLGNPIDVYGIEISGKDKCIAADAPKALLATLWQQLQTIVSKSL